MLNLGWTNLKFYIPKLQLTKKRFVLKLTKLVEVLHVHSKLTNEIQQTYSHQEREREREKERKRERQIKFHKNIRI